MWPGLGGSCWGRSPSSHGLVSIVSPSSGVGVSPKGNHLTVSCPPTHPSKDGQSSDPSSRGAGSWTQPKWSGPSPPKTQYLCFPMEIIILNLPPTICTQDQYVFSLSVIPGPHEPKHLNGFCWPLYQECLCGLEGIPTYHTIQCNF